MTIQKLPVLITDRARQEVAGIISLKKIPEGYGLRIGVKGGGCSGFTYVIGFDRPQPKDDRYQTGTFEVLIEKKHLMHLLGLKVDFVDTDSERGFLFTHPDTDPE